MSAELAYGDVHSETSSSVPLEGCNPAGDTNFTGVTIRRAEGQNKVTVRVVEYGRKRVRHWGEQIIRAGQESESWGMERSKSKRQTNQHGSGKSQKKTRQPSYTKSNKTKGLSENWKSKTVIHKSKKQLLIRHQSHTKVCRASLPWSIVLAAFSKDEPGNCYPVANQKQNEANAKSLRQKLLQHLTENMLSLGGIVWWHIFFL